MLAAAWGGAAAASCPRGQAVPGAADGANSRQGTRMDAWGRVWQGEIATALDTDAV